MSSLLLPVHLMAMLALGLLIGQQGWGRTVIAAYAAALLTGLGALALAYAPTLTEEAVLAATALTGFALAWARPWPWPQWTGATLAAGTGLSLALDSPPEALSLAKANLDLLTTAVGAPVTISAIALLARWPSRPLPYLGVRILGSWIGASAVLVLALHLLR